MTEENNIQDNIKEKDELIERTTTEDLKEIMTNPSEIVEANNDYSDLEIIQSFKVGRRYWRDGKSAYERKKIDFAFTPTKDKMTLWELNGIPKLPSLLTYLKNKYGSFDAFNLIFFNTRKPRSFYFEDKPTVTNVYVNLDSYQKYHSAINPEINSLKISRYFRKIKNEYSKKVPVAFFNNQSPTALVDDLRKSNYKIIENIIQEYETLAEDEKKDLKTIFEHSKLADDTIKEFEKLTPESPKKQLKIFTKVLDKLSKKEIELLLRSILKSKSSRSLISSIGDLSTKDQQRISKNIPEMARMYEHYQKLEQSLKEFKKKIKEHVESDNKNEKDIHKLLAKNYWLFGIEYFGREIRSDIDGDGKRTGETNIGRKRADFIILQRLNGVDTCVVIEIEEANDKIFNLNGTISKEVYDGIMQAVDYNLEQKFKGTHSKGMAIIGSLKASNLSDDEKKRLNLLSEAFPNIEVLTYDQIIDKAETALTFLERDRK